MALSHSWPSKHALPLRVTQPFDLADCIIDEFSIKRLMCVEGRPKL
jgi:hypothetical protein